MTPGTLVRLRAIPYGAPGEVIGTSRGKVIVCWTDLSFTGKHRPEDLVLAGEQ